MKNLKFGTKFSMKPTRNFKKLYKVKMQGLTALSVVAQAMIETAPKKIKSANTDMVLNKKKQRTVAKKKVNNLHANRGTCSQKKKKRRTDINRLIDVKDGDS